MCHVCSQSALAARVDAGSVFDMAMLPQTAPGLITDADDRSVTARHGVTGRDLDFATDARDWNDTPLHNRDREPGVRTAETVHAIAEAQAGSGSGASGSRLPNASNADMADYLTRHNELFNLGDRGTFANNNRLLYNVTGSPTDGNGISAEARGIVEDTLALFEEVLGIDFVRTTATNSNVDIFFTDNRSGAVTVNHGMQGTCYKDYSVVNVSASWLNDYGPEPGNYTYQTYLHEIGHALGLDHAGNYDGGATYVTRTSDPAWRHGSNVFLNDSWQLTMMSYFDQEENSTVDAKKANLISPMIADWIALDNLYGISPQAFSGNTVWGFNTNIRTTVFRDLADLARKEAFTVIDSGGRDTLDFSGFRQDQTIDLRAGQISDVAGTKGNMLIGPGTLIENAVTGRGADVLIGNDAGNRLTGGAGRDNLLGLQGNDRLDGGAGDDRLSAGPGRDVLLGGADRDRLDGGPGIDIMRGGDGNDTYLVSDIRDTIHESAGGGIDKVVSTSDFSLPDHVENISLTGRAGRVAGNGLDNRITGNNSDNALYGKSGADRIKGGGGNDGLAGGGGDDILVGGGGDDAIYGGSANDLLIGGKGADILRGDGGSDTFRFNDTDDSPWARSRDRIVDFEQGRDLVDLSGIDADATTRGNQAFTFIGHAGFGRHAGELRLGNGVAVADTDGDGRADFGFDIDTAGLTAADFLL